MANPAVKNGHIKIANELIEHLATVSISGSEMRIIWVVWRHTWGWKQGERRKDWDWISVTQFEKATGMKKANAYNSLKSLLCKRIILRENNRLKFNQNYNEWLLCKRIPVLCKSITPIMQKHNKTVMQKHNNKYNKANNTKESIFFKNPNFTEAYKGFVQMRKKMKRPFTPRAESLILKKLEEQSVDIATQMLNTATEKGWTSVYPPKELQYLDIYDEIAERIKILVAKDHDIMIGDFSGQYLQSEFGQYNASRQEEFFTKVVEKLAKNQSFIDKLRNLCANLKK